MEAMKVAKIARGLATLLLLLMPAGVVTLLNAAGTPVIGAGGIVNAATNRSPDLPGGDIAQGSLFSIYGVDIGPAVGVGVTAFPLDSNLAGVEITVTQGATTVNAIPVFVGSGQINAIMPSNAPLGLVQVRVICDGVVSEPETITVVQTSVGIFTATSAGSGPGSITDLNFALNTSTNTATPNQTMILWVTGLGGITGADNVPPSENGPLHDFKDEIGLEVFVGGRPVAQKHYAGRSFGFSALDQIIVDLAGDIALGCFTPVFVSARGLLSNTVTMATDANGQPCSDPENPLSNNFGGGNNGAILLARVQASIDLSALGLGLGLGINPAPEEKGIFGSEIDITLDTAVGSFVETPPVQGPTFDPFVNLPPVGACMPFSTANFDVDTLPGMGTGEGPESRNLDAGASFGITRLSDNAMRTVSLSGEDAASLLVGTDNPLLLAGLGLSVPPLFLNGGTFRLSGNGGSEVGGWSVDATLPPPVVWSNQASFGTINLGSNQTFTWSGGNNTQIIQALLLNVTKADTEHPIATGVICLGYPPDGGVTIPSALLSGIAASTPPNAEGDATSIGFGLVGATQFMGIATFNAEGLDNPAPVVPLSVSLTTATFQ